MTKMNELYFGIMQCDLNSKELRSSNLFNSYRVLRSVALYVTKKDELEYAKDDPLRFCFGDTAGRYEYEMSIGDLSGNNLKKYDIYTLYVEPNSDLLMKIVEDVDIDDAKRWLREDRERRTKCV